MSRLPTFLLALACCSYAIAAQAASGRVVKVLPLLLDHQGKHALLPSLYERDAYQVYLRDHPEMRSGMKFAIEWKGRTSPNKPLILRVELRGIAHGTLPRTMQIQKFVFPRRLAGWTDLVLSGDDYALFGEMTAWRVSLWEQGTWEDEVLLSEQTSFLW